MTAQMMKQMLAVLIILRIITVKQAHTQVMKKYYVKPDVCRNGCNTQTNVADTVVCLNWSTIQHSISRYFTSHTDIYFLSGEYKLDRQIKITNVVNFTITGRAMVVFKCSDEAGVFINSSIFVGVQNVNFMNCGTTVINTTSALHIHNVKSTVLSDIVFENSVGPGIAGENVLGTSVLNNITIHHKKRDSNTDKSSYSKHLMGGIVLIFTDVTNDTQIVPRYAVLIKHCTICCMGDDYFNNVESNMSERMQDYSLFYFTLGLIFRQKTFSMNVEIANITITKIVSQNTSLVIIAYNSNMPSSVFISNSSFTNIYSDKFPVMLITIASKLPDYQLTINSSDFCNNTAILVHIIKLVTFTQFVFKIAFTTVSQNKVPDSLVELPSLDITGSLTIERCIFKSNIGFKVQVRRSIRRVALADNLFYNNSLQSSRNLLLCSKSILEFEGYNEFSFNTADIIISLEMYVYIKEGAMLNISYNRAVHTYEDKKEANKSLIVLNARFNAHPCLFQFLSMKENLDKDLINNNTINFNVVFSSNHNYTSVLFGTMLNSCYWKKDCAFKNASRGDVYRRVIHYDTTKNIIARKVPTFCYCDKATGKVDCFKDDFIPTPIYPGQTIPISLVEVPMYQITAIYPRKDFWSSGFLSHFQICQLVSIQPSNYWFQVVYKECVPLFFRVFTNSYEPCSAFFNAIGSGSTTYHFKIGFKKCPLGFENHNGSCRCNKYLKSAFPTLICDIETQTLNHTGKSWIGSSQDGKSILYVKQCVRLFCINKQINLRLDKPDTQCVGNRVGIKCGQCPPGLDAALGTFKCKECTNYMLWLLPVFFLAGILLVFCLFTLNLTVVDGKINGFIFYANITAVSGYYAFPSHNNLFVLLSLCNLDLGIKTCFYRGMTEYDKTWLQFVFPLYLLCIVGILVIASRYSSCVERITRKRVIPVIATVFLLSYSKILLVTAKILFSYATLHQIDGDNIKTRLIWLWDSSIPLFGKQFIPLFIVSLLVLLTILLPLNFCLFFTKTSYRIKFVSDYFKPYLDAYQAPFKDNRYYYFGIELLIRPILFAIGNGTLDPHKTMSLYILICGSLSTYLCVFKPFKSSATAILYISFIFNLGFKTMLFLYFDKKTTSIPYAILFNTLVVIALTEFGCIIIYYLYTSHLYQYEYVSISLAKFTRLMKNVQKTFLYKSKDNAPIMMQAPSCEHLREELLTAELEL